MEREVDFCIGIHLGTTSCCVGVISSGAVKIIPNDQGDNTTPSFVAFTHQEVLTGNAAKNQLHLNKENTIFHFRELLGQQFSSPLIQENTQHWPFKVLSGENGCPLIRVQFKGDTKQYTPTEICSIFLHSIKESVERFLGCEVKNAVLVVPAYFRDDQRHATKDAGTLAGLNVIRIFNEPSTAVFAYGLDKKSLPDDNILVFHLGGRTSNVSLLSIEDGVVEIKATAEAPLGGEDFTNQLVEYVVRKLKKKYQGYLFDPTAMMRLRSACERAKIRLCLSPEVDIQIDSLFEGVEFHTTITADRFEELNLELLKKCTRIVEDILEKEKLKKKQIHEVILTGGGANMKKVHEILQNFFNGKDLNQSIPPEEVIAHGAAIMAAVLVKRDKQMQELLDVEPEEYNTFELTPEQVDAMVKEAEMYKEVASSMDVDDLD